MKEPIWLSVMRAFVGVQEIPGPRSNPMILQWVKDLNAPDWYNDDDKPWCALGMNRVMMACQLPVSGVDFELFRAASFSEWGEALVIPALGCIMTFSRPEGHHVGLYLGERKDAYYILGMNQSNTVGPAWIQKNRLVATRWPKGAELPQGGRVWLTFEGSIGSFA